MQSYTRLRLQEHFLLFPTDFLDHDSEARSGIIHTLLPHRLFGRTHFDS